MKTIYARKYGDTKRIGLRYARRRNQPQIPQIVVFFEAFVICVRVFTFIRAKRVSNCCIQTKNLRECSSNVGVSEVRIMYQIRMYLVSAGRNEVGYRKVAWMLFANSCRCSVGGETIRLSSQSSRVRYSAPLFFFPVFFFPFFFLFFLSMGGGVLCMYVSFFFLQHTTHL